uniref:Uncharacterized protein n=2 Tax=Oryza TaxID=4527 RepID=Q69K23_ORYSJ|nr:hypothetical protein [Oryza sativa Japonica Group]
MAAGGDGQAAGVVAVRTAGDFVLSGGRSSTKLHLGQQQHYQGMQQQQANVGRNSSSRQLHLSILALGQQQQHLQAVFSWAVGQ